MEGDDGNEMPKRRKISPDSNGGMDMDLWNAVDDRLYWEPFNEYVGNCRINANVRQVLREGENSL